MSKKYRFKIGLPNIPAGTLLHSQDGRYFYKTNTEQEWWLEKSLVENVSELFEEVPEMMNAKCDRAMFTEKEVEERERLSFKAGAESMLPFAVEYKTPRTFEEYKKSKQQ